MDGLLLDIVKRDNGYYFSGTSEAFIYALLGFLIVFAGIVIIIAVIWLLGLLMRKTNDFKFGGAQKKKEETGKHAETDETDGEVPDEIKAAIIAAVAAYMETSEPGCEFKVKRIKRL